MAMQLLERQNVYDPDLLMYRTALGMIRSASLNCYVFDVSASSHILLWYAVIIRTLIILLLPRQLKHHFVRASECSCAAGREK